MISRIAFNLTKLGRALSDDVAPVAKKILGKSASVAGKGALNAGEYLSEKAVKLAANPPTVGIDKLRKLGAGVGKFGGGVAGQVGEAANNIAFSAKALGKAASGVELTGYNNARNGIRKGINKVLGTNLDTTKFDGHRFGALIKDSDQSILTGKRITGAGTLVLMGGAGIMGAKEAVVNEYHNRQGQMTGVYSNAPTQGFDQMGASYADNAGATGDLALSLHRQRHSGIL